MQVCAVNLTAPTLCSAKSVLLIGTLEETNQRLWAPWALAGGGLQGDKLPLIPYKSLSPSPSLKYSASPMGDVSGFYSKNYLLYNMTMEYITHFKIKNAMPR